MWSAMIDMPIVRHFRPEAEMKSHLNPSVEPGYVRQWVARVLLMHARTGAAWRPGLSRREMAAVLNISWDRVNNSLKSLQDKSVIRIELIAYYQKGIS